MTAGVVRAEAGAAQRLSWADLETQQAWLDLARFVREGGVVVFPTESSYALGADPTSAPGVAAVFRIKGRSTAKPLPVVAGNTLALEKLGVENLDIGFSGLERAWPGTLTIVVPCREALPASCGRKELAVRIPGHRRLRDLLTRCAVALTATSANLAGGDPLLDLDRLDELVGRERVLAIDEGPLEGREPSTLVRLDGGKVTVLRHGATSIEKISSLAPELCVNGEFSAAAVEIPAEESG